MRDKGGATKKILTTDEAMQWVRTATAERVKARDLVLAESRDLTDAHRAWSAASLNLARAQKALNEALSK